MEVGLCGRCACIAGGCVGLFVRGMSVGGGGGKGKGGLSCAMETVRVCPIAE